MRCPKAAGKPPRCFLPPPGDQQPTPGTSAGWDIQDGCPGWVLTAPKGAMLLSPNHLLPFRGGGELVTGFLLQRNQPGSPSTTAGSHHQQLPYGEARWWERAEHPQPIPVAPPGERVPNQVPPTPVLTCHSKGQESGECWDAEELAKDAEGKEEEDGTGWHGHQ